MNIFDAINNGFAVIVPVMDWLWNFPTNVSWYASIPIIGGLPLMILLIFGSGIFFTIKTSGVQFRYFKRGVSNMLKREKTDVGLNAFSSFMLSTASRVGPGNIGGVTGAIAAGGPGAVFWMWIAAVAGMAIAWAESTMAQIFKVRDGNEYKGGIADYAEALTGNKALSKILAIFFIFYAFAGHPSQSYQVLAGIQVAMQGFTGQVVDMRTPLFWAFTLLIVIACAVPLFMGTKKVSDLMNLMTPVMSVVYTLIVFTLFFLNLDVVPKFFSMVFTEAFTPQAMFGGTIGVAITQGVKRGMNSNDAGKGVLTIPAATAEARHPAEQGFVQSFSVFCDTIIVCTMTAFLIVGGQLWTTPAWESIKGNKVLLWSSSIAELVPGVAADGVLTGILGICYMLFAFSSLLSLMSFTPIAISPLIKSKAGLNVIRSFACFLFVPLGALSLMSGQSLDNVWAMSDLATAILCFTNIPLLLVYSKVLFACLKDFEEHPDEKFVSERIGIKTDVWKDE